MARRHSRVVLLTTSLVLVACAADESGRSADLLCDAVQFDFASGLSLLSDATSTTDRETYAGLITATFGHFEDGALTNEQKQMVSVMLEATADGRKGVLAAEDERQAIRTAEQLRSSLDC